MISFSAVKRRIHLISSHRLSIFTCVNIVFVFLSALVLLLLISPLSSPLYQMAEENSWVERKVQSEQSNKCTVNRICHRDWTLETPLLSCLLLRDDIFWASSQVQVWCCHKYSIEFEILGSVRTQNAALSVQLSWNHNTTSGWSGVLFRWT